MKKIYLDIVRAVNVFDVFDASKHSSVIAHFNQYHVHTGDFEKEIYKIIDSAYRIRENAIILTFFVSKEDAQEQYERAIDFLKSVEKFLES